MRSIFAAIGAIGAIPVSAIGVIGAITASRAIGAITAIGAIIAVITPAHAQDADARAAVPDRQLPAAVLAGVRLMEHRFESALREDCTPERCFSKGCRYISHAVVDRPATSSLPGLGLDPGPGSGGEQVYLTTVECGFAHEPSVRARDARALATRLEAKLTQGWTRVDVTTELLEPLPEFLRDPPEDAPPEPDEPPDAAVDDAPDAALAPPPPVAWDAPLAGRELWLSVLPHFPWMLGLFLATLAALVLIWAARRLGRVSPEEQAMLQALAAPEPAAAPAPEAAPEAGDDTLAARREAWRLRLASDLEADRALGVLAADLLRTGERRLLAKAVILFPEAFPRAFPRGGEYASAKYELAEFLKHADPATLPGEAELFDALDRYAMSAALTAQPDTELIRSLHADFGPAALVDAVGRVPARHGALLFAAAPEAMQYEAVRRLDGRLLAALADQLLRSNRMDPAETAYLLDVLAALRAGEALPAPPQATVSDRGLTFQAPATLSILLPRLDPETRGGLVDAALTRGAGHLPAWTHDTLYGEMLLHLDDERRNDLMLTVPVDALAAWLRVQTEAASTALRARLPSALRAAVDATPRAADATHYTLAHDGRIALAAALQKRLARGDLPFAALLL
ncbi:MAG: hypothetical protein H6701_12080 [Myxococcales bacterium]|nr:hypothetical protein [Myxococcales bacterium]